MELSNLTTYKLGDLIEQRREKYDGKGNLPIRGVSADGFIPPKQKDADTSLYNVFYKNDFVFNPARMELNSIALNTVFEKAICSSLYEIFYVKDESVLIPKYLNLFVKRKQFARQCEFIGWGSAREYCRCADISTISITLPDVPTQQKYVDIYDAMCANQKAYEKSLDDLKLTCDAYIDSTKKRNTSIPLGQIFEEINLRNSANQIKNVLGIDINKRFMKTKASINVEDLANYKVINKNQFAFSGMQTGRDKTVRIALYSNEECAVISPAYTVYKVSNESFLPEFLMIWFERLEFDRKGWFYSDGSVRANLDNDRFFEMTVPQIPLKEQQAIVEVYCSYLKRKNIAEKFAHFVKNICPILIKGAIEEGKSKRG